MPRPCALLPTTPEPLRLVARAGHHDETDEPEVIPHFQNGLMIRTPTDTIKLFGAGPTHEAFYQSRFRSSTGAQQKDQSTIATKPK
jgi:hypothetical protein